MYRWHGSRRGLLRRSVATVAGGAMAGLIRPTVAQRATPETGQIGNLTLDSLGGDVWGWSVQINGHCPGCGPGVVVSVVANGNAVVATRDSETFTADVPLAPGENVVEAKVAHEDGTEERSEPVTFIARLPPGPIARIALTVEGQTVNLDASRSEPGQPEDSQITRYTWSASAENPSPITFRGTTDEAEATLTVPPVDGEYYLSLQITDEMGRADDSTTYFVVADGEAHQVDFATENPAWVEGATIYGAIPRNFGDPGFKAVAERLDELNELNISAIWLAPINQTIDQYFGYEVTDYFELRPEYGTKEDFRALVQAAHARDIRILMDFVPNHTSARHPYFEDAEEQGEASRYYDFYARDTGGNPTYYFDWFHLPNLNYDNPEVQRFMLEAFSYWVREFDVDGFRVDVAWGVRERKPEFWPIWREELQRIKPDLLLLAEASARDPYYFQDGFDAAYDWTEELGHWAWGPVFEGVAPIGNGMREVLTNGGEGYAPDARIFHFLNNNDTDARFISVYGLDLYRVAATMLMTLPGLPCIYTGDEIGAEFLPYEMTSPIDWTDTYGLRDHFIKLGQLRRDHSSLRSRQMTFTDVETDADVLAYLRYVEADETQPPVLVLLNFSNSDQNIALALPPQLAATQTLTDLMTDEALTVTGSGTISTQIPGSSGRVLIAQENETR